MADPIAAKFKYLAEAAHLLAASSPATAAFLGSARIKLVEDAEIDLSAKERATLYREYCRACGNLMVPGWSCRVSNTPQIHQRPAKTSKRRTDRMHTESNIVYTCLRCQRQTSQAQIRQSRRSMKPSTIPLITRQASSNDMPPREDNDKTLKTANANSKQRQKARKGGLQAMLEKNKAQKSNQGGLDLLDFAM